MQNEKPIQAGERTQRISGPENIVLILDANEVFPNDPGQGTPAMVSLRSEQGREIDSGTFNCALESGEFSYNGTLLTEAQSVWLSDMEGAVENFINAHS